MFKNLNVLVGCLIMLTTSMFAYAHNKVVVVPLGAEEAPERKPSTPISKVSPNFSDYTVGVLTAVDKITLLEWQRGDSGTTMGWDFAYAHCASLQLDGHDDWRLPNVNELLSIVDFGVVAAPAIETTVFSNTITSGLYWSSTIRANSLNTIFTVVFNDGAIFPVSRSSGQYVRCVR